MFNILVVNGKTMNVFYLRPCQSITDTLSICPLDWHAIANVFIYAERCNSNYIVYPFFISANLVGVNILLNVLTAFFVGVSDEFTYILFFGNNLTTLS